MDLSKRKITGTEVLRRAVPNFFSGTPRATLVEVGERPTLGGFSERSFRDTWKYLSESDLSLDEKKFLLKGNLDGWMRSTVAIKRGDFNPSDRAPIRLDEGDMGLLSELRVEVDKALEYKWTIDYLVRVIQVTAGEKGLEM